MERGARTRAAPPWCHRVTAHSTGYGLLYLPRQTHCPPAVKQYLPTPAVDSSAALHVQQFVWWHAISTRHRVCAGMLSVGPCWGTSPKQTVVPPPLLVQSPGKLAIIKQEDNNLPANLPACVLCRCRVTNTERKRKTERQTGKCRRGNTAQVLLTNRAQAQPWLIKNDYRRQISMRLMSLLSLLPF